MYLKGAPTHRPTCRITKEKSFVLIPLRQLHSSLLQLAGRGFYGQSDECQTRRVFHLLSLAKYN